MKALLRRPGIQREEPENQQKDVHLGGFISILPQMDYS